MKSKGREIAKSEMRPEYDFSGGVRGKYYRRYIASTNVVVLEPDVHKRFKNATAVNEALRKVDEVVAEKMGGLMGGMMGGLKIPGLF